MTVATLAHYLRCHTGTIYRLLKRTEIPAFKIGSDWRFSKAEVKRWVRKSTAATRV
jgi:excisionase family DNA binding protein